MNEPQNYQVIKNPNGLPIKGWWNGVAVESGAIDQLRQVASMPFIYKWVAAMPDVHQGMGATIGSVIPTVGAVIPAAVGVDIGCGMQAVRTGLRAKQVTKKLDKLLAAIEEAVPHGRTRFNRPGNHGSWNVMPRVVRDAWEPLADGFEKISRRYPRIAKGPSAVQLGTLGSGNHFIEVCVDTEDRVWVMLHSGSRNVGNRIGQTFIHFAKKRAKDEQIPLPNPFLGYFSEGTELFDDYLAAAQWAQEYASVNRDLMMDATLEAIGQTLGSPKATEIHERIACHHNYVSWEEHYGQRVLVTRKGAVSAREGQMGIIPGSMGTRSYLVRGLGNPESFHSCSHGAGRLMSRSDAKRRFSVKQHEAATKGVSCRKDEGVLDETPGAYKPIEDVIEAQHDLVAVVHELKQVVCVKG